MKASERFKNKAVNIVNQKWSADGVVEVIIYKHGWKKAYKFKAKKLYEKDEEILEDEEVEADVQGQTK